MRDTLTRLPVCVVMLVVGTVVAAACTGDGGGEQPDDPSGTARTFMMGFSSLPRELNAEAYQEAFALAGDHGEMVLIRRTPPWADFLPGASITDETADTTASEKRALDDEDLTLFFAIDPTDAATGRDRLAGLPGTLAGSGFGDAGVRAAFLAYAEYVATNYEPAYLALGVEMNLYYQSNPDDFEEFGTLYAEAYDVVKETSPRTQVTFTLQYEDLQGILLTEDSHFPDWALIQQFDPVMDVVAISTYPSFSFASAAQIPDNYYTQLRGFTDRPIAIADMGYASEPGGQNINNGTEADQEAFLERALADVAEIGMPFAIWFAAWDPAFAADGAFGAFAHIGLLHSDGAEKPAWATWEEAARRPYQPD